MSSDMVYEPSRSIAAKLTRRITQRRLAAPAKISLDKPVLSMTFDDCPASAATTGADILEAHGVRGGYYIASSLIGEPSHMGVMADAELLEKLSARGHEIAAHSHSHFDCSRNAPDLVEEDVQKNLDFLDRLTNVSFVDSFAYPYGETSFASKRRLAKHFTNLRGLLPGINSGMVDRAQLRAYEIDRSPQTFERAMNALDRLSRGTPGWMIAFTHDVSETPSDFGMTPSQLDELIVTAQSKDIDILPPGLAARKAGLSR